jgi:hypothetical protein
MGKGGNAYSHLNSNNAEDTFHPFNSITVSQKLEE